MEYWKQDKEEVWERCMNGIRRCMTSKDLTEEDAENSELLRSKNVFGIKDTNVIVEKVLNKKIHILHSFKYRNHMTLNIKQ